MFLLALFLAIGLPHSLGNPCGNVMMIGTDEDDVNSEFLSLDMAVVNDRDVWIMDDPSQFRLSYSGTEWKLESGWTYWGTTYWNEMAKVVSTEEYPYDVTAMWEEYASWSWSSNSRLKCICTEHEAYHEMYAGFCDGDVISGAGREGEDTDIDLCHEDCLNMTECMGVSIGPDGCYPLEGSVCLSFDRSNGGGATFIKRLFTTEYIGLQTYQSSTDWEGDSSRAVDGFIDGDYLRYLTCTHTQKENKPWWAIDLGGVYEVTGLVLSNRVDCCSTRLKKMVIGGSFDKTQTLLELGEKNFSSLLECHYSYDPPPAQHAPILCDRAMVVEMLVIWLENDNAILSLCEVQVPIKKARRYMVHLAPSPYREEDCASFYGGSHTEIGSEEEYGIVRQLLVDNDVPDTWVSATNQNYRIEPVLDPKLPLFNLGLWGVCTASSEVLDGQCWRAFDNSIIEADHWRTFSEGIGAWIKVDFGITCTVYRLRIMQRFYRLGNFKEVELQFSPTESQTVVLAQNDGDSHSDMDAGKFDDITLTPVNGSYIKLIAMTDYGNDNTGLAEFEIWGRPVYGVIPHEGECSSLTAYETVYLSIKDCVAKCLEDDGCAAVAATHTATDCELYSSMCSTFDLDNSAADTITFEKVGNSGAYVIPGYCGSTFSFYQTESASVSLRDWYDRCKSYATCKTFTWVIDPDFYYAFLDSYVCTYGNDNTNEISFVMLDPEMTRTDYLGCYHQGDPRDLEYMHRYEEGPGIRENCIERCRSGGYPYASLYYYDECNCGDSYGEYGPANTGAKCYYPCDYDDTDESCGGNQALEVYAVDARVEGCAMLSSYDYATKAYDAYDYMYSTQECNRELSYICERPYNYCAEDLPCQNNGTCTDHENGFNCTCTDGFTGQQCEQNIDDCTPEPCYNGALCLDEISDYTCICAPGYEGILCETDVDECASSPCQNGGTCTDEVAGYTCSCVTGFMGTLCETDIDDCSPNPCQHGGLCGDEVNGYNCVCPAGYTGQDCETDIDECASSPCQNGALCEQGVDIYTCDCATGYTGNRCQTDIDECSSNPCENGGQCVDQVGSYRCNCLPGFTGVHCQNDVLECDSNPCQHYGICVEDFGGYICDCVEPFVGDQCEDITDRWGSWSDWSNFTDCSATCGLGTRQRERTCIPEYPELGPGFCSNSDTTESEQCDAGPCPPIDGQWSEWRGATPCSATCGIGVQLVNRTCDAPKPQYGGEDCTGINETYHLCFLARCPRPRYCDDFSEWSECSAPCESGVRSRWRSCYEETTTDQNATEVVISITETATQQCGDNDCQSGGFRAYECETEVVPTGLSETGCNNGQPVSCPDGQHNALYNYSRSNGRHYLHKGCASQSVCESAHANQGFACHRFSTRLSFTEYDLDIDGWSPNTLDLFRLGRYLRKLEPVCAFCCASSLCNEMLLSYPRDAMNYL